MTIRPSTYADIPVLLAIFYYARQQMIWDGNPDQWEDNYPSRKQIEEDITCGVSYVIEEDSGVVASFVFIQGDDPTYDIIEEGQWLNDMPYGTIHRIASSGKVKGVFSLALDWCIAHCNNIRIDTHQDNARMLHLIEKHGFIRCGIIYTRDHSPRIAFQKDILRNFD